MTFRSTAALGVVMTTAFTFTFAGPAAGSSADPTTVATSNGLVRGAASADHLTFRGIPYAAPPVGDLRWSSPRPAENWSGVRDATRPGSNCPQTAGFLGDEPSVDENCLFLNVTTPRRTAGGRLPVMVFIHGGGFYSGAAGLYGAAKLATQGDVVVVTPNYRLGIFGFLGHPALGGEPGNFGLEDQQAALRWVRQNAAAFGGDPSNVTLVGESAGSVSTCAHIAALSSAGLFRRAIMQSGPCAVASEWPYQDGGNWYPRARQVAEREGAAAATSLKCTDPVTVVACLRAKTPSELLEVSYGGQGFGPVYGGGFLPLSPKQALATGRFNRVPVIHGTTRDEHRLFVGVIEQLYDHVTTAADYTAEITRVLGPNTAKVLDRYRLGDYSSPSEALAAVWTDRAWSCTALTTDRYFRRYVPTYAFEFADQNAPWAVDAPLPNHFPMGAFHAADLQYLFEDEQFPGPRTAEQHRLSDQMVRYWTRFAHTGDPNSSDMPRWSAFDGTKVQSLGTGKHGIRQTDLSREHNCAFWHSLES